MTEQEIVKLLKKYTEGNCTPEETALVESLYMMMEEVSPAPSPKNIEKAYVQVKKNLPIANKKPIRRRLLVAASVLLALSIGISLYPYSDKKKSDKPISISAKTKFIPGKSQAFLILANGKKIPLNEVANGKIATEGNAVITKTEQGQIAYNNVETKNLAAVYNTVSTPRGGEYILTLSDGTKVWLNAATSIAYPSTFTGKTRDVKIDGEAYFEVAHHPEQPFRVSANDQTIEVLGTHFNVNSYTDEPNLKTTLFEGQVKIIKSGQTVILKPGEQAINNRNSGSLVVSKDVDVQQVLAWKNGRFYFNFTDAGTVLRQIARWYNVELQFRGKVPEQRLSGSFSKYENAGKALEILQYAGVNLKIEGRTIIVE
ncbi:FecR domain-containing protein [Pedobacter steynii]|nr:FecR domain-containing protein [Pedobacter steynii]NQX39025.1 FecR domain-containing protein [Pedobacter steynii]